MLQLVQNILNEIHFGDEEKNSDDVPGGTNLLVYCEINVRKLLPYIPYRVCLLSVQKAIEKKNSHFTKQLSSSASHSSFGDRRVQFVAFEIDRRDSNIP